MINRIATEEQKEQFLQFLKAREEDFKKNQYSSYLDSNLGNIILHNDAEFINILESDHNGTGYLDNLAYAELPGDVGSIFFGLDKNNRRVLVVKGERNNNIVLFERYAPVDDVPAIVVKNCGDLYRPFLPSGRVSEDAFFQILDLVDNLREYTSEISK